MKIDPSRPPSAALDAPGRRGSALLRWLVGLVVLGGLGYGGWWGWKAYGRRWLEEGAKKSIARATYVVTRRELPITVIASGSLKARKSEVIASKVEGKATILEIIKEGTLITPEDVKNGKVLVLLDAADLQERLIQQQITFANAECPNAFFPLSPSTLTWAMNSSAQATSPALPKSPQWVPVTMTRSPFFSVVVSVMVSPPTARRSGSRPRPPPSPATRAG